MAAPTIQIKRGIFTNLPALKAGEPGFTTDKYDLYVGLDGTLNNNKFFGSHRYWTKETASVGSSVKIVEATNNGSNFIALKSPDNLTQDTTYTFPATPSAGLVLQTDGSGALSWVSAAVAANSITGITIQNEGTTVGSALSVTTLNIKGEGIAATASGIGATITLSAASATVAGVSSYSSSDFYFTNTYQVGITTATTSAKGIASFSSTNFSVSAGAVSIANNAVGLGTQTYGQYAKSIVGGNGLTATASNADDGTDYTIDVGAGSGIAVAADTVALKNAGSLSSNTLMKWDSGNTQLTNSSITDTGTLVSVNANLYVNGTLSIGGTAVILNAATLQIADKDIVLGVTTDANSNDVSTDSTANHGGVAIASTVGNPILNIPIQAGVNINPSTYKQFMWIKQGNYTGMGTDAWVSNYAISIGNTATLQYGSRLTVGAGFTVYDTYLDAQDIRSRNVNNIGFVTTTNLKTTNLYDSTNTNGTSGQFLTVTGTGIGWTTISGVSGGSISTATRATTVDTTTATSGTYYPGLFSSSTGVNGATVNVDAGISYVSNTDTLTSTNLTVTGTLTGTATTATKINTTTSTATGYIPFVANGTTTAGESLLVDANIQFNGSTNSLIVQNAQHSTVKALDGTSAITIANTTGAVGIASDLTVSGSLFVAGTTTQINTTNLVVEDRVIELGKVQGTAPTDTTWDLGILFNYYTASANKKASVYWEGGVSRFLFASDVSESVLGINLNDTGAVILGTATPQLTSPVFAPIEVGALWMNDTAGQSVVASYLALNGLYTGAPADRYLQNITVDAGVF